ncbi:MAG: N-formylglutamate amidohydrolase [Planctomycetes bacterium]|nr:N-formylglutamate amidohydrolase [Planctomycetota bacterium]
MNPIWQTEFGDGPLVACAVHDGHDVRPDVAEYLRLTDAERLYEEDPYTSAWTSIASTRIVVRRSRFELDLNRPREKAVYIVPADAWGMDVWKCSPPQEMVERSLRAYDDFYAQLRQLLEQLVARHGRVVVFDLHSYNHIRDGRGGPTSDAASNPEINLGTGSMPRGRWAPIVERWLAEMRGYDYFGRRLDVRENVKFFGGHLPGWIHQNFPETVCALAIEVKKFFMDEWTGELDARQHAALHAALGRAADGVRGELENRKP